MVWHLKSLATAEKDGKLSMFDAIYIYFMFVYIQNYTIIAVRSCTIVKGNLSSNIF